ncbi:MAG: HNH endonuclease [Bifidobacteriaceae bacterium]|jgi:predicted restriction endonuclease|nr:HNH endonuclease [Bifidobacteriaceae bacterium]
MSVFLDLAKQILAETLMPMSSTEIWEYYLENDYKYTFNTQGETPWYTLSSLLQKQVKGSKSTDFMQTSFLPARYDLKYLDYENIKKEIVKPTDKEITTNVRVGQNTFRSTLISKLKCCPVSGIGDSRLLVASHIKPWAVSTDEERLDENNGFIFSINIDKLFDIGLITFGNDKTLLVSQSLSVRNVERLCISPNQKVNKLPILGREKYLAYHRANIFTP